MSKSILNIVTYNIHKGFSLTNRRFILHEIKHELQQLDADVLFIQEIYGEHHKHQQAISEWPELSQFEFLAEHKWPHHVYGKNAIYDKGHHGNAILSKFPFVEWENINVALFPKASRSILHGVLILPPCNQNDLHESHIHVICVHLGLFHFEREKQLSTLIDRIRSHVPDEAPLIIAGDFNDWRGKAERHFHEELAVNEVFKAMTGTYKKSFPSWRPMLAMDRIYSRGLNITACRAFNGSPWKHLSDHIPLSAHFELV